MQQIMGKACKYLKEGPLRKLRRESSTVFSTELWKAQLPENAALSVGGAPDGFALYQGTAFTRVDRSPFCLLSRAGFSPRGICCLKRLEPDKLDRYIGMKLMASVKKNSRSNGSSRRQTKGEAYVLCVRNEGYPASLERRKLYPVVRDTSAAKLRLMRVIDESGEDYLYPADYFIALRLPANVKLALSKAS